MWVTQCHKSSPSHHHFCKWYKPFPVMGGLWYCFSHIKKLYKSPLLLVKSPFSYGFPMVFLLFLYPLTVSSPSFSPRVPYPECDSMPSRRCASLRAVVSTWPDQDATKRCDIILPIGSMYAIYGNIYHQYPNVSIYIYTIHGSYGLAKN